MRLAALLLLALIVLPPFLFAALTGCAGRESVAQVKPPPVRWIVVSPPLVPGIAFVGTTPTLGNAGTCDAPRLVPIAGTVTVRWSWTGPAPGTGVLMSAAGDTFRLVVPADAESLRVWGVRYGVAGCDSVVVVAR